MKRLALIAPVVLLLDLAGTLAATPTVGPPTDAIQADVPISLRMKNIGGTDGAGLCVWTSIAHSARFQNDRGLWDLQQYMSHQRGGGWPDRVDQVLPKVSPGSAYLQYQGKDPGIIKAALASGRPVGVTWNGYKDPHYHGQRISHMVSCVQYTDAEVVLLDNNFIGDDQLLHMTPADFQIGWTGGSTGWAVVLLAPAPPPVPRNLLVKE